MMGETVGESERSFSWLIRIQTHPVFNPSNPTSSASNQPLDSTGSECLDSIVCRACISWFPVSSLEHHLSLFTHISNAKACGAEVRVDADGIPIVKAFLKQKFSPVHIKLLWPNLSKTTRRNYSLFSFDAFDFRDEPKIRKLVIAARIQRMNNQQSNGKKAKNTERNEPTENDSRKYPASSDIQPSAVASSSVGGGSGSFSEHQPWKQLSRRQRRRERMNQLQQAATSIPSQSTNLPNASGNKLDDTVRQKKRKRRFDYETTAANCPTITTHITESKSSSSGSKLPSSNTSSTSSNTSVVSTSNKKQSSSSINPVVVASQTTFDASSIVLTAKNQKPTLLSRLSNPKATDFVELSSKIASSKTVAAAAPVPKKTTTPTISNFPSGNDRTNPIDLSEELPTSNSSKPNADYLVGSSEQRKKSGHRRRGSNKSGEKQDGKAVAKNPSSITSKSSTNLKESGFRREHNRLKSASESNVHSSTENSSTTLTATEVVGTSGKISFSLKKPAANFINLPPLGKQSGSLPLPVQNWVVEESNSTAEDDWARSSSYATEDSREEKDAKHSGYREQTTSSSGVQVYGKNVLRGVLDQIALKSKRQAGRNRWSNEHLVDRNDIEIDKVKTSDAAKNPYSIEPRATFESNTSLTTTRRSSSVYQPMPVPSPNIPPPSVVQITSLASSKSGDINEVTSLSSSSDRRENIFSRSVSDRINQQLLQLQKTSSKPQLEDENGNKKDDISKKPPTHRSEPTKEEGELDEAGSGTSNNNSVVDSIATTTDNESSSSNRPESSTVLRREQLPPIHIRPSAAYLQTGYTSSAASSTNPRCPRPFLHSAASSRYSCGTVPSTLIAPTSAGNEFGIGFPPNSVPPQPSSIISLTSGRQQKQTATQLINQMTMNSSSKGNNFVASPWSDHYCHLGSVGGMPQQYNPTGYNSNAKNPMLTAPPMIGGMQQSFMMTPSQPSSQPVMMHQAMVSQLYQNHRYSSLLFPTTSNLPTTENSVKIQLQSLTPSSSSGGNPSPWNDGQNETISSSTSSLIAGAAGVGGGFESISASTNINETNSSTTSSSRTKPGGLESITDCSSSGTSSSFYMSQQQPLPIPTSVNNTEMTNDANSSKTSLDTLLSSLLVQHQEQQQMASFQRFQTVVGQQSSLLGLSSLDSSSNSATDVVPHMLPKLLANENMLASASVSGSVRAKSNYKLGDATSSESAQFSLSHNDQAKNGTEMLSTLISQLLSNRDHVNQSGSVSLHQNQQRAPPSPALTQLDQMKSLMNNLKQWIAIEECRNEASIEKPAPPLIVNTNTIVLTKEENETRIGLNNQRIDSLLSNSHSCGKSTTKDVVKSSSSMMSLCSSNSSQLSAAGGGTSAAIINKNPPNQSPPNPNPQSSLSPPPAKVVRVAAGVECNASSVQPSTSASTSFVGQSVLNAANNNQSNRSNLPNSQISNQPQPSDLSHESTTIRQQSQSDLLRLTRKRSLKSISGNYQYQHTSPTWSSEQNVAGATSLSSPISTSAFPNPSHNISPSDTVSSTATRNDNAEDSDENKLMNALALLNQLAGKMGHSKNR